MQKCVKCNNEFKYKEILKHQWDNSLKCSKCCTEHRSSTITNIICSALVLVPTFVLTNVFRIFGFNRLLYFVLWIS